MWIVRIKGDKGIFFFSYFILVFFVDFGVGWLVGNGNGWIILLFFVDMVKWKMLVSNYLVELSCGLIVLSWLVFVFIEVDVCIVIIG